jgi:hypothetical protein
MNASIATCTSMKLYSYPSTSLHLADGSMTKFFMTHKCQAEHRVSIQSLVSTFIKLGPTPEPRPT